MLKPDWVNEIDIEHFLWVSYELLGNGCSRDVYQVAGNQNKHRGN